MLFRLRVGNKQPDPAGSLDRSFQTPDGSVLDRNGRLLYISGERFRWDIVEGNCCFLCGNSVPESESTDEHIIPDWVLREYSLHALEVTLPNGATLPYSRYRVPCCTSCNSLLGQTVEAPISQVIKGGYATLVEFIQKESAWPLFAWMNLLFLKTHLKDRTLRHSLDARQGTEKIADFYDWSPMHHIHCIVRAYYTGAKLDPRLMGSVFILPAKSQPRFERFDYADFSHHKTMMIRLGEVAIVCVLNDAGATYSLLKDWLTPKLGGRLSPVQLREILARFAHANAAIRTRPDFHTTFEQGLPYISVTHPDQFEADPGDPLLLGELMEHTCAPLLKGLVRENKEEVLKGIRSGGWTFLITPDGKFDALSMEPVQPKTNITAPAP